jgi:hypothetical protein
LQHLKKEQVEANFLSNNSHDKLVETARHEKGEHGGIPF